MTKLPNQKLKILPNFGFLGNLEQETLLKILASSNIYFSIERIIGD